MKCKGMLGIIVAVALLVGGYGAVRYMRNAVIGTVRETVRSLDPFCSVGKARFSLWNNRLTLTDLRLRDGDTSFDVKRLELAFPLELIFDTPEGDTELVTEVIAYDTVISAPGLKETIREMRVERLRADPARLLWLLREPSAEGERFLTLLTNINYAREQSREIFIEAAASRDMPAYTLAIGRTGSTEYDKGSYGSLELANLRVLRQDDIVASLDALNMTGIHRPPLSALKVLLSMSAAPDGPEALALLRELFHGPRPLVEQARLRNLTLTTPELPLRVADLALAWPSSRPPRYSLRLRDVSLATSALVDAIPGLRLPGLKTLHLNFKNAMTHEDGGTYQEMLSLDVQDVASLRLVVALQGTPPSEDGDPPLGLFMTRIVRAHLEIKDLRLMAYIGGNQEPSGVKAAEYLESAAARLFTEFFGPQAYELARKQLADFVWRPGALDIRFAPETPVDVLELRNGLADMASALTVTVTPGHATLEQQIGALFAAPEILR